MRVSSFPLIAAVALAAVATPAQARPMEARDLQALTSAGEVQASPDGETVLFTASTNDVDANTTTSRLMRVAASGAPPQQVASELGGFSNVRWSPDGTRAAFIARAAGRQGIWVLDAASGQVRRVCDYDRSNSFVSKAVNVLSWSPDGTQLAFAGTTDPLASPPDPLVVDRIQYKTRTSFSDTRRSHVYVVPAAGGTPRAVTGGRYDEHSIDWSRDGAEIIFLSNREPDPDANLNYDIFAVNVADGTSRRITNTPGVEFDPHVSPDGRWIAYTATTRRLTTIDSIAEDTHVWAVQTTGAGAHELNGDLDRRSSAPAWTPDGRSVVYTAPDHGKTVLYRVPRAGGESVALVDRKAAVGTPSVAGRSGAVAFALSDPAHAQEVFRLDGAGGEPRQLTNLNTGTQQGWDLVEPETVSFRSFDGTRVEGLLYPALRPGRAPMILNVHGGPHGQHGYAFSADFQYNAARGYATLALNPRGSAGYGQEFADGTIENWGGGDYKDLIAGVRSVLRTHSDTIDRDRLGVTGGSYGGFMTNWIVTQTSMFKAAVARASLSNLISFYSTSLYQDLVHAEFNGYPWDGDNFRLLWRWSPLAHIKRARTPTLLIHGEQDNDVHITQAEEMYTALRQQGVEARLARYPREGHGFSEPKHQLDAALRTLDWMDQHL